MDSSMVGSFLNQKNHANASVASFSKEENHANLGMRYLRHFQKRKIMPTQVCLSRVIFKTGKSCRFRYALTTSFSNRENMPIWALVTSCNHGYLP